MTQRRLLQAVSPRIREGYLSGSGRGIASLFSELPRRVLLGNWKQTATLSELAPEDQYYYIRWGSGFSAETDEGERVDPELGYRDYPVPRLASDNKGHYDITIEAGDKSAHSPEDQETPLGAILFLYGEYAECAGGRGTLYIRWQPGKSYSPPIQRMICGSHRYAPL